VSDAIITVGTVVFMMTACALIPMLARTWKVLLVLAAGEAVLAGYFWRQHLVEDWDNNRVAAGIIAGIVTVGLVVGFDGASVRLVGRNRGWRASQFPVPELLAIGTICALTLLLAWRGL